MKSIRQLGRRALILGAMGAAAAASLAPMAALAAGDNWPSRPVRLIVPFSAGSGTDLLARMSAVHLSKVLGQPFIVDNRQGADGIIGTDEVARAAPDGYTLGFIPSSPIVMNPALYAKLPYDPVKNLTPVFNMANVGLVLAVQPALPIKNVADLVAYAKAHPGKLNFAAGSTFTQLAGEVFKSSTGTDIVAIPYKGTAPQVTAMLGNEVDIIFDPFLGTQYMKNGRFRPLAITSSKRSSVLPDLPTLQEAGLKDYAVETWIGMFAPAGTPKAITDRLYAEMTKILELPDIKARLADLSYEPVHETQEQLKQRIVNDTARWKKTVADAKFPIKNQ